ncbi:Putative invertase inhibitor [Morus notabilis]|uniref:Putative invertase inhibitor n=1 Tax=Morus notabilis TaxID=981085 RepID=W9S5S0_9ROSA|nr:cell wall / vacuolar inhibitor of fructosidase 1 [Morus notabilis]EXC27499.1 Putative invertase inhibitor [Morus notabilis]
MRYAISILVFHVALFISLQFIHCYNTHALHLDDDHDGDDQGTDLIEKTCKRTPHYDLCVSSLESNPESSGADLRGLARIMVDLVLSKATETLDYIRSLLKQEPDPELEKSLAYCAELYIPVVKYSLPQAIDALLGGHFGFANYGISDAAKQANACDKNFSKSSTSPLAEKNSLLNDLSEVAAAIISILLKG